MERYVDMCYDNNYKNKYLFQQWILFRSTQPDADQQIEKKSIKFCYRITQK